MFDFHKLSGGAIYSQATYKETNKPITDKFVDIYKSLPVDDPLEFIRFNEFTIQS